MKNINIPTDKPSIIFSQCVSLQAVKQILDKTQDTIKTNQFINNNLNAFSSAKVNSVMNQIGELIQQEPNQTKKQKINKKQHSITHINQTDIFNRDNMTTNSIKIQINQNKDQFSQYKDEFRLSSSKVQSTKSQRIFLKNQQTSQKDKKQLPDHKRANKSMDKIQSQLVSLLPSQNTQKRGSAFSSKQNLQSKQKNLQKQIDKHRQQKLIQQQQTKRNAQKQNKLQHLLTKQETVLSFNYQGEYIKISKRELQLLNKKRSNNKPIQNYLQIDSIDGDKFWKYKKDKQSKRAKTLHNQSVQMLETPSNKHNVQNWNPIKNLFKNRETTLKKLSQLKKNSIQITRKRNITEPEQKEKISITTNKNFNSKKFSQSRGVFSKNQLSHATKTKAQEQEEAKRREVQMDFLIKKLQHYHQDNNNFMPEWYKNIEQGCKFKVFACESSKNKISHQVQKNNIQQSYDNSSLMRDQRKSFLKSNKTNSILQLNQKQIKSIQNLQNTQRQPQQLQKEWQKRRLIRQPSNQKKIDQKGNVRSRSGNNNRSLDKYNNYLIRNNTTTENNFKNFKLEIQEQQNIDKKSSANKAHTQNLQKYGRQNINESEEIAASMSKSRQINRQNTINLNRNEFNNLKKHLQMKKIIHRQNKPTNILNEKNEKKQTQSTNKLMEYVNAEIQPITIQNRSKTIQLQPSFKHKNIQQQKYIHVKGKIRSFSMIQKRPVEQKSPKKCDTIKVNNQKLKSSLLEYSLPTQIYSSSILRKENRNNRSTQQTEQKNSLSQKLMLPINSINKTSTISYKFKNQISLSSEQEIKSNKIQKKMKRDLEIIINKPFQNIIRTNLVKKNSVIL